MNLWEKLSIVQKEIKAPKGQWNDFSNYYYRSCEDIVEAAKPLCSDNGLLLTLSDTLIHIEGRFYVEATATVINVEDGEKYFVTAQAREAESKKGMDSAQVTGAASSYARKYALNGLFGIDDEKDPDTKDNKADKPDKPKKQSGKDELGDKLNALIIKKGATVKGILDKYKVETKKFASEIKFITADKKQEYIDRLEKLDDK
jgi:hypothetical protein